MLASRLAVLVPNSFVTANVDAPPASRVPQKTLGARRLAASAPHSSAGVVDADLALVRRLLLRDGRAWRAFHRRFEPLVLAAVGKVVRRCRVCRDGSDVDEIRAALFASLVEDDMRKLRRFDPSRGCLDGWLHRLATHAAWDHVRARTRQCRGATGESALAELLAADDDSFHKLDIKRCTLRVQEALRALPEPDRCFAELLLLEERAPEQVAAIMNLAIETVYTKKSRLQARLRRLRDTDEARKLARAH